MDKSVEGTMSLFWKLKRKSLVTWIFCFVCLSEIYMKFGAILKENKLWHGNELLRTWSNAWIGKYVIMIKWWDFGLDKRLTLVFICSSLHCWQFYDCFWISTFSLFKLIHDFSYLCQKIDCWAGSAQKIYLDSGSQELDNAGLCDSQFSAWPTHVIHSELNLYKICKKLMSHFIFSMRFLIYYPISFVPIFFHFKFIVILKEKIRNINVNWNSIQNRKKKWITNYLLAYYPTKFWIWMWNNLWRKISLKFIDKCWNNGHFSSKFNVFSPSKFNFNWNNSWK